MLDWLKNIDDNIIAIIAVLVALIIAVITWAFSHNKKDLNNNQSSTIDGDNSTVKQVHSSGGMHIGTHYKTAGITLEHYTQDLKEKEEKIIALLVDQALSERDKSDLTQQLAEIEKRLSDTHASHEAHIKSLKQRIEELTAQEGIIPKDLLDEAIAALQAGKEDTADAILAKVEESSQSHIEAAAEAAFQRAKIAEDKIEYRLALQHAERATQLIPDKGRYANLAGIIANTLAEYDKAIGYYEQALKSDLATFGEDHPDVASDRNNLGLAWNNKGEYDKAIGYFQQALKSGLATFGEDHPNVATYRNNLGLAWHSKGKYKKAIGYYEQALKSDLATFGEDHPSVAIMRNNLGGAWESKGEYDKAIGYFEQAVNIALATLGEDHPNTKIFQQNLLRAQIRNGQPAAND